MKVVAVSQDFTFRASHRIHIQYRGGIQYERVPEAHAKAIVAAGVGIIIARDEE